MNPKNNTVNNTFDNPYFTSNKYSMFNLGNKPSQPITYILVHQACLYSTIE